MKSISVCSPVIYIVDDDNAVRAALGLLAESQGWQVHLFESAQAFLDQGAKANGRLACLVVDLQMPRMNGAELLEQLKTSDHRLPTIVLTAWPESAMARRALAAGADQVMSKPFDPLQWLQAIRSVLHRQ